MWSWRNCPTLRTRVRPARRRLDLVIGAAKTALADAERLHARLTDLNLAVVSAEQIADPHIAAVARARDAVTEAEAAHRERLVTLRESVSQAQAESEAAFGRLKS